MSRTIIGNLPSHPPSSAAAPAPAAESLGSVLADVLRRLPPELEAAAGLLRAGEHVQGIGRLEPCLNVWRGVLGTVRAGLRASYPVASRKALEGWIREVTGHLQECAAVLDHGGAEDLAAFCDGVLAPLAVEGARIFADEASPTRRLALSAARWSRNLRALRALDRELSVRVELAGRRLGFGADRLVDPEAFFTAAAPDGGRVRLHRPADPEREAEDRLEDAPLAGQTACILFGLGVGYVVRPLLERLPADAWILIIEADLDLFCRACAVQDFEPLLRRPNTRLFIGDEAAAFHRRLGGFFGEVFVADFAMVEHRPSFRLRPAFYAFARRTFSDAVRQRRIEMSTLEKHGRRLEQNSLRNAPAVLRARDVDGLENAFAGVPAVVVGAGPSLDAALPLLREARDRVLLIAVGKALRPLLAAGCPPHAAVTLDPLPVTADYFHGVAGLENVMLLFDPDVDPAIPEDYPGPLCSYAAGPFYTWALPWLGDRRTFPRGMTVAHQAFFFARHAGADPIAMVGVDLAFPDGRSHAANTVPTWGGTVSPQESYACRVPSVTGGEVLSAESFRAFVALFEAEIANTRARVVNCSPAGARIAGTAEEPLEAYLRRYAVRPIDASALRGRERSGVARAPEAFRSALAGLRAEVARVSADADDGLAAVRRGWRLDPENPADAGAVRELVRAINAPNDRIRSALGFQSLVGRIVGHTAVLNHQLERELARLPQGSRERLRVDLLRMNNIFEGFGEAARFLQGELDQLDRRFDGLAVAADP